MGLSIDRWVSSVSSGLLQPLPPPTDVEDQLHLRAQEVDQLRKAP